MNVNYVDDKLRSACQNYFVDPLQFSGVPITKQLRIISFVVFLCCLVSAYYDWTMSNWFGLTVNGILIPMFLKDVVFGITKLDIKQLRAYESLSWRVYIRYFLVGLLLGGMYAFFKTPDFFNATWQIFTLSLLLRIYVIGCEEKPPVGHGKVIFSLD